MAHDRMDELALVVVLLAGLDALLVDMALGDIDLPLLAIKAEDHDKLQVADLDETANAPDAAAGGLGVEDHALDVVVLVEGDVGAHVGDDLHLDHDGHLDFEGSPSYVSVVKGVFEDTHFPPQPPPPPLDRRTEEEAVWKIYSIKLQRQSTTIHRSTGQEPRASQKRLPHTLRTPAGTINVCGQCLRPGHRADKCRRDVTCRGCGGVGHKGIACQGDRRNTTVAGATGGEKQHRAAEGNRKRWHGISLHLVALDTDIVEERELMKAFSIITITESRKGPVQVSEIVGVLSCLVDEEWKWEVKSLLYGCFIVAFPIAELEQKNENGGSLRVLAFNFKLEPWTPDLGRPARRTGLHGG
ncbi:hypothetical protein J5N97_022712 [Dioscorea zingiberensis]|uniref:CCHC-type domain-containing protein n=1 Tax=Dioscorea zingiberensis TaxID=325984 RepID=A0A9D5CCG3_9LILI|nr:hypothetical protein J5N97_022712 [Dioscorea zingiberensis]